MNSFLKRFRNPSRGIGRISYPLRSFAYAYEVTMVCIYSFATNGFDLETWIIVGFLFAFPHLAHLAYKYSNSNPKVEVISIYLDSVIAGCVIVELDFNYFIAFTLSLLSIANVICTRGWKKGYLPVLGLALGAGIAVIPHGVVIVNSHIPSITIISAATVFLYYIFFATQVFAFASKSRSKTKVIRSQREELAAQHDDLQDTTNELKVTLKHLVDSMNYAKTIQHAMLPAMERFQEIFDDGFVYFKPLQELSGDFYWYEEVGDVKIVAAVDCTGHGIPGALMSMLGSDMLLDIVRVKGVTNPAEILREMNEGIIRVLNQNETQNRDGMDMAVCAYDTKLKKLMFSGANNPLYWVSKGELIEIKGCRIPVGGYEEDGEREYVLHELNVDAPGVIYLFSDGYKDQFGGDKEKKFMARNFRELLFKHHNHLMNEQKKVLEETMSLWMNGHQQVDDMLVMGVAIK